MVVRVFFFFKLFDWKLKGEKEVGKLDVHYTIYSITTVLETLHVH